MHRPWLEPLEDRTLLSVAISGTIFNNLMNPPAPVPAATVFLDANQSGQIKQDADMVFNGPTTLAPTSALGENGSASLTVAGVTGSIANFKLNINVTDTQPNNEMLVALFGPTGYAAGGSGPEGPDLFLLNPTTANGNNVTFNGTITDSGATVVGATTNGQINGNVTGSYRPTISSLDGDADNAFNNPQYFIYSNPNGVWRLLFFSFGSNTTLIGLTLNSWSLEFTGSDQSTTTDAHGNYSFSNLAAGTYHVAVQNTATGTNASLVVNAQTNQTGVNIAIAPNPDLLGSVFQIGSPTNTIWGSAVTVNYTISNRGLGAAAAFNAQIWLTEAGVLNPADSNQVLLATITDSSGLMPGASFSGSTLVTLPGQPPTGFSSIDSAFLNMKVNSPTNSSAVSVLTETSTANDSNQGQGLDLAPVLGEANAPVSTAAGTQQNPSVAVDPNDPSHVVVAYMDYSLLSDGFAGIRVADSHDSGTTWQLTTVPLPNYNTPGGAMAAGYPVAHFDTSGNLFVTFMAAEFLGPLATPAVPLPPLIFPSDSNAPNNRQYAMHSDNGIYVAEGTEHPGGLNWSLLAPVTQNLDSNPNSQVPFDTLPDLAIDSNGSTISLYATWTRFYPAGQYPEAPGLNPLGGTDVFLAVSTNGGATWQNQTQSSPVGPISVLREAYTAAVDPNNANGMVIVEPASSTFKTQVSISNPTLSSSGNAITVVLNGSTPTISQAWSITVAASSTKTASYTVTTADVNSGHTLLNVATQLAAKINALGIAGLSASVDANNNIVMTYTGSFKAKLAVASPTFTSTSGSRSLSLLITPPLAGQTWQLTLTDPAGDVLKPPLYTVQPMDNLGNVVAGLVAAVDQPSNTPSSAGNQEFSHVTVDSTHGVIVSYYLQSNANFRVRRSTTGGQSFSFPLLSSTSIAVNGASNPFDAIHGELPIPDFNNSNPNQPFYSPEFPNIPVRDVIADPTRPGVLYAVEAIGTESTTGSIVDPSEIDLARSTDNGLTWERLFAVDGSVGNLNTYPDSSSNANLDELSDYRTSLNDDDGSAYLRDTSSSALAGQEISLQAMPHISVDNQGNIVVIWYDTRRTLNNQLVDVYGTVSTDGGQTFSPNFRLTNLSFDPAKGTFTDPTGGTSYLLGNFIGLATANGTGYAAWTDTVNGSQQIFVTRFSYLAPQPAALDRFGPDNTAGAAANLGNISGLQTVGQLVVGPGSAEFLEIAPATTKVLVTLSASQALNVQIYDVTGTTLLGQGTVLYDSTGNIIGAQVAATTTPGVPVLIEVSGVPFYAAAAPYSMQLQVLTLDFGTTVTGSQNDSLVAGNPKIYALTAPVTGSVEIDVTAAGTFQGSGLVTVLNAQGVPIQQPGLPATVTPGKTATILIPIIAGQQLLVVVAANGASQGNFTLAFYNRDQFEVSPETSMFYPVPGSAPVSVAIGDLNGDGSLDIAAANPDFTDPISVFVNDGTGLYGAAQTHDAGTGSSTLPGGLTRSLTLADFNGDDALDIAMTNFASADVSAILNLGAAEFSSDHRSDAVFFPGRLVAANLGNGKQDLVVFPETTAVGSSPEVAVLMGLGDGTFAPPVLLQTDLPSGTTYGVVGDFTGNGVEDIAVFSANGRAFDVFLGKGDGTFSGPLDDTGPSQVRAVVTADFRGVGIYDIAIGGTATGSVYILESNGDGTFTPVQQINANTDPAQKSSNVIGLAVADMGGVNGTASQLGLPDGRLDLLAITQPLIGGGLPQLNVISQMAPAAGQPLQFATATQVATGNFNGALATGALIPGNAHNDIAIADGNTIRVIYNNGINITPNTTAATARNLGTVTHVVTLPQVIAPGFTDAYYKFMVPTEVVQNSGPEVVDLAALFQNQVGPGLQMQLLENGQLLASGTRMRVEVPQGTVLTIHIGGAGAGGFGVYTLDIDVLPQVVSIASQSLLPAVGGQTAGPVNSLVITLQGDLLDPTLAQATSNYQVVWLGASGVVGGADNKTIPIDSIVYNPGANTQVSAGRTFPNFVRQTITLVFANPLPVGSYLIELFPSLQSLAFNSSETAILAPAPTFEGHPVVSVPGGRITDGVKVEAANLVQAGGRAGSFAAFQQGTPFLTNLHDDLGAVLNTDLTANGDNDRDATTQSLINQILARFNPAVAATPNVSFLVIALDPVNLQVADPNNNRATYDLASGAFSNNISNTFMQVGGAIEVLVLANVAGTYTLDVATGRGGEPRGAVVLFTNGGASTYSLTDAIREGTQSFEFTAPAVTVALAQQAGGQAGGAEGGRVGAVSNNAAAASNNVSLTFLEGVEANSAAASSLSAQAAILTLATTLLETLTLGPVLISISGQGAAVDNPPGGGGDLPPNPDDQGDSDFVLAVPSPSLFLGAGVGATQNGGGRPPGVPEPPEAPKRPAALHLCLPPLDLSAVPVAASRQTAPQEIPPALQPLPAGQEAFFDPVRWDNAEDSHRKLDSLVATAVFAAGFFQNFLGNPEAEPRSEDDAMPEAEQPHWATAF